jgi:hypothetical protein
LKIGSDLIGEGVPCPTRRRVGDRCDWRIEGSRYRLLVDSRVRGRRTVAGWQLSSRDCTEGYSKEREKAGVLSVRVLRESKGGRRFENARSVNLKFHPLFFFFFGLFWGGERGIWIFKFKIRLGQATVIYLQMDWSIVIVTVFNLPCFSASFVLFRSLIPFYNFEITTVQYAASTKLYNFKKKLVWFLEK